jgi:hypothetical protein
LTEGSTPASAETGEKLLEKDEKLTNRKKRENVETENPNGFKRSWDRESPKLSEPGREFFSVADHDADCSATRTLCYPQPIESKRLFKKLARCRGTLTDTDREVLRELCRAAAETSKRVEGYYVSKTDMADYYEALAINLKYAEPEADIAGQLKWLEDSWGDEIAEQEEADKTHERA